MKTLLTVALAGAILCLQGCTHNDRDSAGLKRLPEIPPTEATAEPARNPAQPPSQSNPEANGGLSLRAAAPYSISGAPVAQSVNPGPFVQAGQARGGAGGALPSTGMLTRSADGTMSGPSDLPAASTGWGTTAQTYESPTASRESAISAKSRAKRQ